MWVRVYLYALRCLLLAQPLGKITAGKLLVILSGVVQKLLWVQIKGSDPYVDQETSFQGKQISIYDWNLAVWSCALSLTNRPIWSSEGDLKSQTQESDVSCNGKNYIALHLLKKGLLSNSSNFQDLVYKE